ncbi:NUDIX hydrolase [Anaerobacillus alkaliphilus]|uniref:NUDIX hydrolase n=1 Tax=Anaerobacillus alkaliphilus TaxID=1548597 RepID=A0A4Q0VUF9_9BACI|nr:NUDIX hydrolase [Anaerobacillus alkaliphilus]RXJ02188.1 NUDIX hydrolase [Anaerobacillus alkaliphilus]
MKNHRQWNVEKKEVVSVDRFEVIIEEGKIGDETPFHFSYVTFDEGVCILPITDDNQIVCLQQYRHALNEFEWELPAGRLEPMRDSLDMAKQELQEETGFVASKWRSLGYFYPSPGSTNEKIHLFLAEGLVQGQEAHEATEQIDVHILSRSELLEMVSSGSFRHGAGLAAVARYLAGNTGK